MLSQVKGLITNRISAASTIAPPIQSACLPQLKPRSKMDEGSPERTAAYMFSHPKNMISR